MKNRSNDPTVLLTDKGKATPMTDITADTSRSKIRLAGAPNLKTVTPAAHYRGEAIIDLAKTGRVNARLVSLHNTNSPEASRYHRLRHAIEGLSSGNDAGIVIGITSPRTGEGKTFTAINLAGALAQDPNARVLLVDLDLRQPGASVREYLGIRKLATIGVVDWITDNHLSWEQAAHFIPEYNLYFMPSGCVAASPYELLTSNRFKLLLQEARQRYDFIILDTAAVLPVPDSQLISEFVNGFLMVVAAKNTPEKILGDALNLLAPEKVLGLVFNRCSTSDSDTQAN